MKIPTLVTNRTSAPTTPLAAPTGRGATPEAFGATVGQGISMLGQAVEQQAVAQQRFVALRQLNDFSQETDRMFAEAQRAAANNPAGFSDNFMQQYGAREQQFLEALPGNVRDEFSVRTGQMRESLANESLKFQFEQTDTFFKQNIEDAYNKARVELGQGGTSDDLDAQRASIDEMIETTGLTDAEKTAIRRKAYQGLEAVVYKNEQIKRLSEDTTGAPARDQAIELMDIIGGGSPQELQAAALQGEQLAAQGVGSIDAWSQLPTRARAVLIAVAADYNGLPEEVANAAKSGNLDAIAAAIRGLPTPGADDLGDAVLNPGSTIDDDPRYANLPYEDRIALLADAEREVAAISIEADRQQAAETAAKVNALHVALYDGVAKQMEIDQAREEGWLTDINDIEKADKLLAAQDEGLTLAQEAQNMIASNQTFDPNSTDDKKRLNALVGKDGLAAIEKNDSDYFTQSLVPTVRRAQDIPTDVVGKLVGMMRNSDSTKAKWALDALAQLQQASPAAFAHRMDEGDEATVTFWQDHKDLYTDEQVMAMVRGGLTPEERRINKELRTEAQDLIMGKGPIGKDLKLDEVALKTFDSGAALPQGTRSALLNDYHTLFEDEYARSYGNVELAKQRAGERLKRFWATTEIGGKRTLMRDAPEVVGYMPVDGKWDWIETQVLDELGYKLPFETNIWFPRSSTDQQAWKDDPRKEIKSFQLLSDEQTRAEAGANKRSGEAPSYMILVTDMDGNSRVLMDEIGEKGNETLAPKRMYFEFTDELRAEQERVFNEKRAHVLANADDKGLMGAIRHSMETGIPVPPDLLDNATPEGIRATLMNEDPAALDAAEEEMRRFLFGNGVQGGIATGQYHLPGKQ